MDAGLMDAGLMDAGLMDAGLMDAGLMDAGLMDAGLMDAGLMDAGPMDAGPMDAGQIESDAGSTDAGLVDGGGEEAPPDAGPTQSAPAPRSFYNWGCGCGSSSGVLTLFPLLLLAARRRSRRVQTLGPLLAILTVAGSSLAATPDRLTLIFPGLTPGEGVSTSLATTVSDVVQSKLIAEQAWAVRSGEDLAAVLGVERQKQMLGCSDAESSCMSELAGALNAQRLIRGSVAKLGDSFLLTLVLIDLSTGRPLNSITERLRGAGNMDAMLDAVDTIVKGLRASDPSVAQGVAGKPLEDGLGLVIGLRGDVDVLGPGVAPGLFASWSRGFLGLGVGVIIAPLPGARAEVRFIILPEARVRPWVGGGATFFYPWLAPRAVVGATAQLGPVQLGADAALEYFPGAPSSRTQVALLLGLSAGYRF